MLLWIMNLGFAGGDGAVTPPVAGCGVMSGLVIPVIRERA